MTFSLNFPLNAMILATGAADLNQLSEAELLAHYPGLALGGTFLLGAGLLCDLYLLAVIFKGLASSNTSQLLQVSPKPWGGRDLMYSTGLLVLMLAIGNALITIILKLAHVDEDDAMPWMLVANMSFYAIGLAGFLEFFRRRQIVWQEVFGLRSRSVPSAVCFGGLVFLAVLPPLAGTFVVYDKLCRLVGIKETPQPVAELLASTDSATVVVLVSIFAVVVAPVFEELFFRGFAYPALKQRWGTWKALAMVSALFALVHQHVPSLGPLFALAVGLGLAYELTGSLAAPITMHALFNTMNVAMLLYVRAHS